MFKPLAAFAFAVAGAITGAVALAPSIVGAQEADSAPPATEIEEHQGRNHGPKGGLFGSLDVDKAAAREAIDGGATLGEALEAQGVDLDAVRADAAAQIEERLAAAVDAGRLTQEEADAKAADAADRIEAHLDGTAEDRPQHEGKPARRGPGRGHILERLDIDREALRAAVESGLTFEEALADQGVDVDQIQADAQAQATKRLEDAVSSGRLTQGQADAILERIENGDFAKRGGHGPKPAGIGDDTLGA